IFSSRNECVSESKPTFINYFLFVSKRKISFTMEFILLFLKFLFWIFLSLTFLGMIKPWWVLWFLDFNNRLMVLRYYGIITVLLGLAVFVSKQLI
ncbi:MAG: hypothetical protein KAI29_09655, partial [Cyclobacteriaceae bacterium]|nr:hypothetical protein [Cyclobacteriaceae bacterium]